MSEKLIIQRQFNHPAPGGWADYPRNNNAGYDKIKLIDWVKRHNCESDGCAGFRLIKRTFNDSVIFDPSQTTLALSEQE